MRVGRISNIRFSTSIEGSHRLLHAVLGASFGCDSISNMNQLMSGGSPASTPAAPDPT